MENSNGDAMNAKLYISKTEIAFDFDGEDDRDKFFSNLDANASIGFSPQDAAKKVGQRTIQFDQSKFEIGYVWPVLFLNNLKHSEAAVISPLADVPQT